LKVTAPVTPAPGVNVMFVPDKVTVPDDVVSGFTTTSADGPSTSVSPANRFAAGMTTAMSWFVANGPSSSATGGSFDAVARHPAANKHNEVSHPANRDPFVGGRFDRQLDCLSLVDHQLIPRKDTMIPEPATCRPVACPRT
jgi:hypothetical protein